MHLHEYALVRMCTTHRLIHACGRTGTWIRTSECLNALQIIRIRERFSDHQRHEKVDFIIDQYQRICTLNSKNEYEDDPDDYVCAGCERGDSVIEGIEKDEECALSSIEENERESAKKEVLGIAEQLKKVLGLASSSAPEAKQKPRWKKLGGKQVPLSVKDVEVEEEMGRSIQKTEAEVKEVKSAKSAKHAEVKVKVKAKAKASTPIEEVTEDEGGKDDKEKEEEGRRAIDPVFDADEFPSEKSARRLAKPEPVRGKGSRQSGMNGNWFQHV